MSPGAKMIREVAEVTKKAEATVRQWAKGAQTPDALTCDILAQYYGCKAEELFPRFNRKEAGQ